MSLLKKSQKYIEMRYGNYMEYQKNFKQWKTAICIKIYKGIHEGIRNYETTINSIPFSDRQTNRET